MKIGSWNIRGLGGGIKKEEVRRFFHKNKLDVAFRKPNWNYFQNRRAKRYGVGKILGGMQKIRKEDLEVSCHSHSGIHESLCRGVSGA